MIRIDGLTKNYGALTAVDNLSLQVRPGEIYGFLGPNGAGKTSTIKILVGLLKATSGQVTVAGFDVEANPDEAKRAIGYVSDEPHPYDLLTGREFLLTMAALYDIPAADRSRRVEEALERFDLLRWGNELTESYSHGMKQKLMIGAALIHEPQVIIADEPLVGLDPRSARALKQLFRDLAKQGRTVLLATHILEIAEKLCDRVGIIQKGRLVAQGSMDEMRTRMKTPGMNLEEMFMAVTGEGAEAELARSL